MIALNGALLSVATFAALALKHRYGTAGAEELNWLLAPATFLVEAVTGHSFVHEARIGFVGERLSIAIVPACAGVNFLVIAYLTLSFGFVRGFRESWSKVSWLVACAPLAYGATLAANTMRIAAAIGVHQTGLRTSFLTGAEIHRALGVVVYLCSLWMLYASAERTFRKVSP